MRRSCWRWCCCGRGFASFAAQRPEDYARTEPVFDLRTHLNGPIRCEGVIYGPLGRVASRFTGDFEDAGTAIAA